LAGLKELQEIGHWKAMFVDDPKLTNSAWGED
jgi:hypothetical protein